MDVLESPETIAAILLAIALIGVVLYFAIPSATARHQPAPPRMRPVPPREGPSWADRVATDLGAARPDNRPQSLPFARPEPGGQLMQVMAAPFSPRRIMSKSEYDIFRIVEREIAAAGRGHRVFAQTCLGEILTSPDRDAFAAINAKRTDMLVVGRDCMPCFAVEYQGEGHHQSHAAARDAIKKEALRRAGIGYVEVLHTHSPDDTQNLIRMQLRLSSTTLP